MECDPTGKRCVLSPRSYLHDAHVIGIQKILHEPGPSGGRSAWRNALPYSITSKNAGSSAIDPVNLASQLGSTLRFASTVCCNSRTACSTAASLPSIVESTDIIQFTSARV